MSSITLIYENCKDILQAVHVFVLNLKYAIPPLPLFSLFVAAIVHDYEHPGVNNHFLYKILDPIAIQYNGISVFIFHIFPPNSQILENMHIKEAFTMTMGSPYNWLQRFTRVHTVICLFPHYQEQFMELHQLVTQCILGTE